MKKYIVILFIASTFSTVAMAGRLCNSNGTRELETCAKENLESSDKKLNLAYKDLASKLSGKNKEALLYSQRGWISYKDKYCQSVYDYTFPGKEAGIEKFTCLDSLTKTRTKELNYINSGSEMDDFLHAADVVSQLYEGGDRSKFIEKLVDRASTNDDPDWTYYITKNCKLTAIRLHEERKDCMARQGFHRY